MTDQPHHTGEATSEEADEQFVDRMRYIEHAHEPLKEADRERLLDLATRGAAVRWRPIEEAPKDGTRFLAIVDGAVRTVVRGKTSHVPIYGFCLADQGPEDFDVCRPTHWMPLPSPPATQEKP